MTGAVSADILCASEYFRGLSRGACERLASVCRQRTLRKREVLFREQARGDGVYLLLEGRIRLHKTSADGAEVVIRTLKPGETFGEVVLFEQDRYPVTATALMAARVIVIPRHDLLRLLDFSDFRNDFIALLMRRQRYLAERIRYLSAYDVEQRFFLFLREQYGELDSITLTISKKDIAAAIGATPETFSRLLQRLRKEKALQWKGKTLTVSRGFWPKFSERLAED
jgi:CRP/FNR family transcriptional regulator